MRNELENGLTLVQQTREYAVDLNTLSGWYGWLFVRGADGLWVSSRKLAGWEIMQAEDQRDAGIVQHGTTVRAG